MKYGRHILASFAALLLLVAAAPVFATIDVPASAYGEGAVDGDDPRVETRLLVDAEQVAPGDNVRVGVLYTLDPEWHVYWRNTGDAGLSTDTAFSSEQASFGPVQWPAPRVFVDKAGEVYTFGYSEQVLFFTEATVSEGAAGELEVGAEVDYLACRVECIPGDATLSRTIAVGEQTEPPAEEVRRLFEKAQADLPRGEEELAIEAEVVYSQKPIRPGDTFQAALVLDYCPDGGEDCVDYQVDYEHRKYAFIPDKTAQASFEVVGVASHPDKKNARVLQIEGEASSQDPRDDERLSGVVHLQAEDGTKSALLVDEPFPRGPEGAQVDSVDSPLLAGAAVDAPPAAAAAPPSDGAPTAPEPVALWKALLLALLGGMILNLMPCVFPVLAIKVSSFTELVHESKTSILSHGLAYTGGIVSSMIALAVVVVGLRAAGTQVGWGFQFQEPLFIVALCAILVLFALNLFGVFDVSVSATDLADKTREAKGVRRSFGEGILAVVLATPCSAPFLGTAVGFALTSSALNIFAIFIALGLGLALPFVVLTLSPGWARVLPKPGAWMGVLKEVLGFALLGTVIWLFWILGQMVGAQGLVDILIFLSALSLFAWFFGKIQYRFEGLRKWASTLLAAAVVGGIGVWVLQFEAPQKRAAAVTAEGGIQWREWSEDAVQEQLDAGRTVFVDFTADWCITCKVNERTVIDTPEVKEAIAEHEVVTFKADWTNPDERIRQKLAEHGKGGVPMYLVYYPDRPDQPEVLPELLTVDLLVEAFSR